MGIARMRGFVEYCGANFARTPGYMSMVNLCQYVLWYGVNRLLVDSG